MAVQTDIGAPFIESVLGWVSGFDRVVVDIARAGIDHIKVRTRQGNVDRYGKTFTKYSKTSRRRGKTASDPVTLTETGAMLNALVPMASDGTTRIDTSGTGSKLRASNGTWAKLSDVKVSIGIPTGKLADRATFHIAPMGRMPLRDFLGLDDVWIQEAADRRVRQHGAPIDTSQTIKISIGI